MPRFKPVKNRVLVFEFCHYFIPFCALQVLLVLALSDTYVDSVQHIIFIFALFSFVFAYSRVKSAHSDIELNEDSITGPRPTPWVQLGYKRVTIPYAQLRSKLDDAAIEALFAKQIFSLDDGQGQRIRIIKALYEPQLLDALKQKLIAAKS